MAQPSVVIQQQLGLEQPTEAQQPAVEQQPQAVVLQQPSAPPLVSRALHRTTRPRARHIPRIRRRIRHGPRCSRRPLLRDGAPTSGTTLGARLARMAACRQPIATLSVGEKHVPGNSVSVIEWITDLLQRQRLLPGIDHADFKIFITLAGNILFIS